MKRVLGWLKRTQHDRQIIGATTLNNAYMWIDASYAVHEDMRRHTGGALSLGIGVLNASAKTKVECKKFYQD